MELQYIAVGVVLYQGSTRSTRVLQSSMVLAALGAKLRDSLRTLHTSQSVDKEAIDALLKDVTRALMEADVHVKLVLQLRERVLQRLDDKADGKAVQRAVVDELVSLLTTDKKPYNMKRGKPNVILFVGLQGAGKVSS